MSNVLKDSLRRGLRGPVNAPQVMWQKPQLTMASVGTLSVGVSWGDYHQKSKGAKSLWL